MAEQSAGDEKLDRHIRVAVAAATDTGLVRSENQDFVIIGDLDAGERLELDTRHELTVDVDGRGPLFVVCDGMGGGDFGTIASKVAARTAWRELSADAATGERLVFARQMRRSIRAANVAVRQEARRLGSKQMGTTAAVVGIAGGALVLALVGDCRAYVYRLGHLTQVTRDQSVVSALVSAGALTDEQARRSERRHMILQALGPEADVDVSLSLLELRRDDRLLLSSDGLHGVIDDHLISVALGEHSEDEVAALERLFELAHRAGAPDNISAVLARIGGEGLPEPRKVDRVPRFTELDPAEEGDAALTSTSLVARRLARRAGIQITAATPNLPATGTHAVITMPKSDDTSPRVTGEITGPAQKRVAANAAIHWIWFVVVAGLVGLVAWIVFT